MEHLKNIGKVICLIVTLASFFAFAKAQDRPRSKIYQGSSEKINAIISTKLDIGFVFEKQILTGKAWLTIQPYSKAQGQIVLDAKNMVIKRVEIHKGTRIVPLKYQATEKELQIFLDRLYQSTEQFQLYIEYQTIPLQLANNKSLRYTLSILQGSKSVHLHKFGPVASQRITPLGFLL